MLMRTKSTLADVIYDMADELAESNDRAEAVDRARQYPALIGQRKARHYA